ncbi:MAG: phosphatase PAP2 family protein [Armatimonadota bacterium]|nr:phosphatase PAP2 family protein [Armatimonadota bacterium]
MLARQRFPRAVWFLAPVLTLALNAAAPAQEAATPPKRTTATLEALDTRLFHVINLRPGRRDALDPLFTGIMPLGGREAGAIAVGLYVVGVVGNNSKECDAGVLSAGAMVGTALVCEAVKGSVSRRRPVEALGEAQVRVVGAPVADSRSFPSGHTATAFAWAAVLSGMYPEAAPLFLGAATLVGVGRVRVGAHYPSDVLAGAAIGFTVGRVVVHNRETLLRREEPVTGGTSVVISRTF